MKNKTRFLARALGVALMTIAFAPSHLPAQDMGRLETNIKPDVTGVFVDGEYKGTSSEFRSHATAIQLTAGDHEVRFVDPRNRELRRTVNIPAGLTVTLHGAMTPLEVAQPPFGMLKTKKAGRAAVYLDGRYHGQADEFNGPGQGMLLKTGNYDLRIEPVSGGTPHEEKIMIEAGRTKVVRLQ